jgi:hypothetical protein
MLVEMIKSKSKVFDAIKGNLSSVHPSSEFHQDTGIAATCQEFQKPKQECSPEAAKVSL